MRRLVETDEGTSSFFPSFGTIEPEERDPRLPPEGNTKSDDPDTADPLHKCPPEKQGLWRGVDRSEHRKAGSGQPDIASKMPSVKDMCSPSIKGTAPTRAIATQDSATALSVMENEGSRSV